MYIFCPPFSKISYYSHDESQDCDKRDVCPEFGTRRRHDYKTRVYLSRWDHENEISLTQINPFTPTFYLSSTTNLNFCWAIEKYNTIKPDKGSRKLIHLVSSCIPDSGIAVCLHNVLGVHINYRVSRAIRCT